VDCRLRRRPGVACERAFRCGDTAEAREYSGVVRVVLVSMFALLLVPPALGADGEPRKALTAKGQAIAQAVVLKKSDLSAGFVGHPATDDPLPKGARCDSVDESDLTVTGDANSPNFSRDAVGIAVGSSASVYRSDRESSAAWRRAGTVAAVRCFADLVRLTSPAPRKVRIVSAKRMPFPQIAPGAIAYRVVASVNVGGRNVKAYFDAILLRRGAVQSALVVTSVGRAVGLDQERALAGVLAARMKKATAPSGPVA